MVDDDKTSLNRDNFNSGIDFIQSYLKHFLNNKLTIIERNVEYALKQIDKLDSINCENQTTQKRIKSIQSDLHHVLTPVKKLFETIHSVQNKIDDGLERLKHE